MTKHWPDDRTKVTAGRLVIDRVHEDQDLVDRSMFDPTKVPAGHRALERPRAALPLGVLHRVPEAPAGRDQAGHQARVAAPRPSYPSRGWPSPRPACAGCAPRRSCATSCARRGCTASDLVLPLFVQSKAGREPIAALPGIDRLSISAAVEEAGAAQALGLPAVLLFGIPDRKDAEGTGAYDDEGIVQLATRAIKEAHPELARHDRRLPLRVHRPRPLRPRRRRTATSTTTRASSSSRAPRSRTRARAPTSSRRAT